MDARPLSAGLSVSPQITPADMPVIAAAGFRTVLCNRPDGEAPDQPDFAAIAAAARAAGLTVRHIPVAGPPDAGSVAAFRTALDTMPGPILAFCRTGTRSAMLWALANADRMAPADILRTAGTAGYDLGALAPRLALAACQPHPSPRRP